MVVPAPPARASNSEPGAEQRADRAVHLARLGELSAARRALLSEPLALGDQATLQQLRDPDRRPSQPYAPLDPDLLSWPPVALPAPALLTNLRRSRRGAAPGPSGLTADIARLLLDDADSSEAFCDVVLLLARARLPTSIASALGLGRLVALRKPAGGVRGRVVGDFLRRLVARTLAQHTAATLMKQPAPTSLPCPRVQGLRLSPTASNSKPILTPAALSYLLMAVVHSTS